MQEVFNYIKAEEAQYKTIRVPVTGSVEWNMHEHTERMTNLANGWYHKGANDGQRPYDDIITPIINVARRSEGFDVKDIVPFVNDKDDFYKSFLIKKYHTQWARKNELDTFIDEMVDSSIIYDLALIKNVNNARPLVVPLQQIAFCDQTNIMSGPICLKHQYTPSELQEFSGKWDDDKIEEAIIMSKAEKTVAQSNDKTAQTPGKYITVYELRGSLPENWLDEEGSEFKYTNQLWIVCYYTGQDGSRNGIVLFKGKDKKLSDNYKALVINPIHGRACGKSIVETLMEPQTWNNYSAIKIKQMLDSAITVFQTDSDELGDQRLDKLKLGTLLKHEPGKPITQVQSSLQNLPQFTNHQISLENKARVLGSASDAQLGTNPVSGTPFALQNLVVQQGQGIHEFRQGKIATFMADVLYRDWILEYIVDDMNSGKEFSEELSFDELEEITKSITKNLLEKKKKELVLNGDLPSEEEMVNLETFLLEGIREKFSKRAFFEVLEGELQEIPVEVMVNIKGKQKNMAQYADSITNIMREIMANPTAFSQIPGLSSVFNELLENSGLNPIDFSKVINAPAPVQPAEAV